MQREVLRRFWGCHSHIQPERNYLRLGKRPSERSRELIQGLEKLVFLQSKKPHILWVIGYALVAGYCFRSRGNSPRLVLLYFQIINFKSIPRKKSKLLSSVQSSCSVVSNSLRLHELQHAGPPCPLPSPRVHPNTCPSSRWCHPTISPSVVCFSSCPQSFPASGSFPMKIGNPFQTKQGNRPSCHDQEEWKGSVEVVPGTSVFPSSGTGVSGNFWGHFKGAKYRFALQYGLGASLDTL